MYVDARICIHNPGLYLPDVVVAGALVVVVVVAAQVTIMHAMIRESEAK